VSLPALVAALLRPKLYPHRPADVTLVQTHISYVFLAGDAVYKIKKPVRFSFLDFSTLAQRRHFCHEEIRLNRRLAPDVYLEVVGICRSGDDYRLGTEDDPAAVEYAVHMRRLPDDRMLDRLLDRHQVTAAMIDAIAARLAEFHRNAAAGPQVTANGDPAAIWRVLEDNYNGVRPFRGNTIAASDDDAIQRFARDFLARNDALFRKRQAEHRVRECHGDLHSEHVCFSQGLSIFDCIEFNEVFRYCDVASDIAFLAMDLDYHGHPELAAHFVARYASEARDTDLPRLVPFYQCYRAYVRGKVDSLKSAEEEVGAAERDAARRSAVRHFALAYRYTWTATPCLVAIAGLSGTGKSAIASALHARTGCVHLNSDVIRKQLAGVPPQVRLSAEYYSEAYGERTYAELFAQAGMQLAAGHGVILDATFQRRAGRDTARALARAHGVPFLLVECRCNEDEIRRRLERRAYEHHTASDADWNIYLEQRRCYEPFADDEVSDRLVLDTTAPPADLTTEIEAELRARLVKRVP
jgi:uncharacterized protein